ILLYNVFSLSVLRHNHRSLASRNDESSDFRSIRDWCFGLSFIRRREALANCPERKQDHISYRLSRRTDDTAVWLRSLAASCIVSFWRCRRRA
ncbi:MAG TPA: hypothetical protein VJ728_00655, partial [Candidatus Binataceae bacterium]|nr:hypothetical protein [Candidatus Binataceae bacterium]